MTRTTSAAGRAALMAREGCRLTAYRDSVGIPTIGVGHTGRAGPPPVEMGLTITAAEAERILAVDLAPVEDAVDRAIPATATTNAFDACVSLAFNVGVHGFVGSTVVHKLRAGDSRGAADAFLMWDHPPDLRRRREAERAQFLGSDSHGSAAVEASPSPVARPAVPKGGPEPAWQAPRPSLLGPHLLSRKPQPGFWARIASFFHRKAA